MKKELPFRHRLVCAIPYSLIHFLISYGCFRQFVDNACNLQAEGQNKYFLEVLENKTIEEHLILTYAFVWESTREGRDFWYRRDLWYDIYLKKLANIK